MKLVTHDKNIMTLERYARYKDYLHSDGTFGIAREVPRCIAACPAGCDVQGYVRLIDMGRYEEAYSLIKETIPFPASIGRICHHPCESDCKRGFFDDSIAIAALKRFAGDYAMETGGVTHSHKKKHSEQAKKRIAIIGAGPAGLTAAYRLAMKGYEVKIFDKLPVEGGMLFAGIPPYRLPKEVLKREIDAIKDTGIEIAVGAEIDASAFEKLRTDYDAIFIAIGAHVSRQLGVPGEDLKGVVYGVDFLRDFNLNYSHREEEVEGIGKRIAVVGGGNVAIDVARSAVRLGSAVTIVYRRTKQEMPAREEEIEDAEEEGVKFMLLANPTRILGADKVEKLELIRMRLGALDESGRRLPEPIKGSEFLIDVDMVVLAIGQASDLRFLRAIDVETVNGRAIKADSYGITSAEGIFAGGDCVRGAAFAVDAIADGNEAAESIDRFLRGVDLREGRTTAKNLEIVPEEAEYIKQELIAEEEIVSTEERKEMPVIGIGERGGNFKEINLGYSEDAAFEEAERCFNCRTCLLAFKQSQTVAEHEEVDVAEFVDKLTYVTGVNKCAECGECTASCPVTAINPLFSPRRLAGMALLESADKLVLSEEIWLCTTCGICDTICPHGVEFLRFVQGVRALALAKSSMPHFVEHGLLATEEVNDSDRLRWLEAEEDLKVADEGEVYYFAGCLSYLDRVYRDRTELKLLEIGRSTVRILNSIGVVPAVSKEEQCCGHDSLWMGDQTGFRELMNVNIEAIRKTGAKTVVFSCAECLRTFEKDYRRFYAEAGLELDLKFVHLAEFLRDKDLPLNSKQEEQIVTYHDPCRLRHLGVYEEPRAILNRVPGIKLKEMEHNRERAPCCGVGAMLTCGTVARQMQTERLIEAKQTEAAKLLVSCPKCWIHLDCANQYLKRNAEEKEIEIEDLTLLISSCLGGD